MEYEIKRIKLNGKPAIKFKCPKCGEWAYIDKDQFNGKVSIFHDTKECGFHETIDLSKEKIR